MTALWKYGGKYFDLKRLAEEAGLISAPGLRGGFTPVPEPTILLLLGSDLLGNLRNNLNAKKCSVAIGMPCYTA